MSTYFLAEVSSNHSTDLDRCLQFVDAAAKIGCDGVKFQLFRVESLFAPEILARSAMHRARKAWELPVEFLPEIAARCRTMNLDFCCTPFDLPAVEQLLPHVDQYKIASYELTWPALLRACAATGKPVILSTGMATLDECVQAVGTLKDAGCASPTVLHCVSHYPTLPKEANLESINTLREACGCRCGWSDHSVRPGVIHQAVFGYRASLVEFHLDLEGQGAEYASGHCWLPEQMREVIAAVRDGEAAEGIPGKQWVDSEDGERLWRADPEDGLRPFRQIRKSFQGDDA
jgi:N-acetylneuraminate synthase